MTNTEQAVSHPCLGNYNGHLCKKGESMQAKVAMVFCIKNPLISIPLAALTSSLPACKEAMTGNSRCHMPGHNFPKGFLFPDAITGLWNSLPPGQRHLYLSAKLREVYSRYGSDQLSWVLLQRELHKIFVCEIMKKLTVKFERTYHSNDTIIIIWSKSVQETAEISKSKTISNICGALQIFDNLNRWINKIAPHTCYSCQYRCWLFDGLFVWVIIRTTSRPVNCYYYYCYYSKLTVTIFRRMWSWVAIIVLATFHTF